MTQNIRIQGHHQGLVTFQRLTVELKLFVIKMLVSRERDSNTRSSSCESNAWRPDYTLCFCSCVLGLHFTFQMRPKVHAFCFPFLLSLNWSVTSAMQTEIEHAYVLIGLLAGLQCLIIITSLHAPQLQLCTKTAAKLAFNHRHLKFYQSFTKNR